MGRQVTYTSGVIYEGDCLDVMKNIDDNSVDMVLCDLPYGITKNDWDSVIPLDELWKQYRRIVKPKGVVALMSHGIFTAQLIVSNKEWFRYKFVWIKDKATGFLNAQRQPIRKHEDVCIFYTKQPDYNPVMTQSTSYKTTRKSTHSGNYGRFTVPHVSDNKIGSRYPSDILYCRTTIHERDSQTWHPTQKPVALGRYLIRLYTKKGDVVLDNTFGSGSFIVSAALEERRFIGIEKNEEVYQFDRPMDYIELVKERLSKVEETLEKERNDNPIIQHPFTSPKGIVDVDSVIKYGGMDAS